MAFNFPAYRQAIANKESYGGNYGAIGPITRNGDRAYGAFQVMGNNIPSWTERAGVGRMTPQEFLANPSAQEAVFKDQSERNFARYGSVEDTASVWFTGQPYSIGAGRSDGGNTGAQYVGSITRDYHRYSNDPTFDGGFAGGAGGSAASKGNFLPDSMYGPGTMQSGINPAGSSPYGALGDQNPSAPQQATNNGAFGDYMPGGSLYGEDAGTNNGGRAFSSDGTADAGGSRPAYAEDGTRNLYIGDPKSADPSVQTLNSSGNAAGQGYDPRTKTLKKDDVPTAIVEAGKAQASAAKSAQEQSDAAAGKRQLSSQQRMLDIFQRVILGSLGIVFVAAGVYGLSRRAGVTNTKVENFIK